MEGFRHLIPSADALVVFEAAARHLNFTRAARELCVTQAAVSRRVRGLEEHLGLALFRRAHRSLELTPAGHELADAVAAGLQHMATTALQLQRRHKQTSVTVAANNAVAFLWLRPRLAEYMQANPEIDVKLVASDRELDDVAEGIDLAIRYGRGDWPGVVARLLFQEEVFPVCAPAYLEAHPEVSGAADLARQTLLHMVPRGPDWITWPALLRALGTEPPAEVEHGVRFNNFPILMQAAIDGQGIAIGSSHLADEALARGQLVRPVTGSHQTGRGYYLTLPAGPQPSDLTAHLRDWLLQSV